MAHLTKSSMKKNHYSILIIFTTILSGTFFSCSSKSIGFSNQIKEKSVRSSFAQAKQMSAECKGASQVKLTEQAINKETKHEETSLLTRKTNSPVDIESKSAAKEDRKEIRKEIKETLKMDKGNDSGLGKGVLVIIAILLPPLAVALVDGITGPFWLDIALTLLFYLPGLIYALFRIFRQ